MKKLFILPILCVIALSACQQKANKEAAQNEISKEKTTEILAEKTTKTITEKEPTITKIENKTILDTIFGTSNDGEPIKIFVYKYLYPDNKKYIRDFDIVNNKDSVVFSGMIDSIYWEGQVGEEDFINLNMKAVYSFSEALPIKVMLGFYINPIDEGMRWSISKTIKNFQYTDSIMHFLNLSFDSFGIDSISLLATPVKCNITVDSLYSLNKLRNEKDYFWQNSHLIFNSLKLAFNDSIPFEEIAQFESQDFQPNGADGEIYVAKYISKAVLYHYKKKNLNPILIAK